MITISFFKKSDFYWHVEWLIINRCRSIFGIHMVNMCTLCSSFFTSVLISKRISIIFLVCQCIILIVNIFNNILKKIYEKLIFKNRCRDKSTWFCVDILKIVIWIVHIFKISLCSNKIYLISCDQVSISFRFKCFSFLSFKKKLISMDTWSG